MKAARGRPRHGAPRPTWRPPGRQPDFFYGVDQLGDEKRQRIRNLREQMKEGNLGAAITLWEVYGLRFPLDEQEHWPAGIDVEIRRLGNVLV